jgi:hypothetical protein
LTLNAANDKRPLKQNANAIINNTVTGELSKLKKLIILNIMLLAKPSDGFTSEPSSVSRSGIIINIPNPSDKDANNPKANIIYILLPK